MHATADVAQGRGSGQVEQVVSGQVGHFHTLAELPAFRVRVATALDTVPEAIA
jgi:hypothetical protein